MARRPTHINDSDLQSLIKRASTGIGIDTLYHLLNEQVSRRTLQRRLARLVANGILRSEGKGRSTRYVLRIRPPDTEKQPDSFPLSPSGLAVRQAVSKSLNERTPVGYNRDFLDKYRPNKGSYLTPETIAHLSRIGRTPDNERPAGTYARNILDRLLVELSWASSRLEGNTYSLLDTKRLIELGQAAEGKDAAETQMILNHKAAIEFLVESGDELTFNRQTILNLHALLSDNLLSDPAASGRLRRIAVRINDSVYHPLEAPQLVAECFQHVVDTAAAIRDPFEQAFFAIVHLPYLQPFEDVSKRVSRLAANIPLARHNLCPLSFVDVSQRAYIDALIGVYELNRVELLIDVFVWAYERSCQRFAAITQSLGQPDRFRLRFRNELTEVVGQIVRGLAQPTGEAIAAAAVGRVPPDYMDDFVRMAVRELEGLHEGNYARFRLRPSEYEAWQDALRGRS
ncbi:MAG: Fic family protein [Acidobacteriota bacterium]